MRSLPLLALPVLIAGCSISINFETDGQVDFTIGDIGNDCSINQDSVPEGCVVESSVDMAANTCVITADCSGVEVFDIARIQQEIDDATNGNSRIRTQVEEVVLNATGLSFDGFTGDLPPGTTATVSTQFTYTDDAGDEQTTTLFTLTEEQYLDLIALGAGQSLEIYMAPAEGTDWRDDPFLSELNEQLDTIDGSLPITASLTLNVSDVAAFQGASGATGILDFFAAVVGTGGISLRDQTPQPAGE